MTTQLARQATVESASPYALLLARMEELERLNATLRSAFEAASRDSEELRQTNAVQDQVLGFVAHELRAPLTTILGNASILLSKRNALGPSTVELALQDIQADARRLQRLIANLLVLARPRQENPMPAEPLDACHLARMTIKEHLKACPGRQISLTGEDEMWIVAHGDYTEEVLINLLSNAEKYSAPEEKIEIRLRRAGSCVEVSVLDRGQGIAKDEVDAIFEPFYRSAKTSSKALGLGLGLAVCKRLVEIQGGQIWVAPRQGGGSEFTFALPSSPAATIGSARNGLRASL